jgi:hypothetical protein
MADRHDRSHNEDRGSLLAKERRRSVFVIFYDDMGEPQAKEGISREHTYRLYYYIIRDSRDNPLLVFIYQV